MPRPESTPAVRIVPLVSLRRLHQILAGSLALNGLAVVLMATIVHRLTRHCSW